MQICSQNRQQTNDRQRPYTAPGRLLASDDCLACSTASIPLRNIAENIVPLHSACHYSAKWRITRQERL